MNNKKHVIAELAFVFIAIILFVFMLPGLAVSSGNIVSVYFDGLNELSMFGLIVGLASVGMLFVTYQTCLFLQVDRKFMVGPFKATIIAVIILPLSKGALNFFSSLASQNHSDTANQIDFAGNVNLLTEGVIKFFIQVIPVLCCLFSIIVLAVRLIRLFKDRYRG
ncbi:hypothetical protein FYL99_RS19970 [Escherichia coli]|nr:hypothetical protein [Escherichia coli]